MNAAPKRLTMIERNFYKDEFEELIRDKTDQYKMYPSDKVWMGIYNILHTRRKRFITGMSILISSILFFAGKELLTTPKQIPNNRKIASSPVDAKTAESKPITLASPLLAFSDLKKENLDQPSGGSYLEYKPGLEKWVRPDGQTEEQAGIITPPSENFDAIEPNSISKQPIISSAPTSDQELAWNAKIAGQLPVVRNGSVTESNFSPEGLLRNQTEKAGGVKALLDENKDKDQINWLAENAMANLVSLKKYSSEWQLYFSPTANYRKISGGSNYSSQSPSVQNVPIAPVQMGSANSFVDNNPAVGFEVGSSIQYRVTRNISLRAGLQFNYSRYTIQTYTASQPQPATIILSSVSPSNGLPQTYTNFSSIQNFGGKYPLNLENQYFQLSAPMGMEMRIFGNGRLQFNIAGTLQPTYLFNRNSYLLTTDYSSYTQDPPLIRKWNLNGDIEAFFSYRLGNFRWQIGPQFGYQLLSTYTDKYPLKENLMEYGIKIGITKTIR